jgi:hypothetical protein
MLLADSTGARRRAGAAIAAALHFYFPKSAKLSLVSYVVDRRHKKLMAPRRQERKENTFFFELVALCVFVRDRIFPISFFSKVLNFFA